MLSHTASRRYLTALAGGAASVLAAIAIAAPANAAEVNPLATVPDGPELVQDGALPAVQDVAFHFTRPGG